MCILIAYLESNHLELKYINNLYQLVNNNLTSQKMKMLNLSSWFISVGILIFSGSLYILAITEIRILGAITPIGGVSFILGWLILAWTYIKNAE